MSDLSFIKSFIAITQSGSFRIAAERNNITQPAVSQHIQTLEQKVGAELLERHGKKIRLTPAGKTFLPYAKNILNQYEEAKKRIREGRRDFQGTIRIATIYSIGLYELQPILKKFLRRYPKVNLHVEYHNHSVIYEMILNRTIDFGLVAFPQDRPGIHSDIFLTDQIVLVQPSTPKTIYPKTILPARLEEIKLIGFSPSTPTGKIIHKFFKTHNIHPQIAHEYDNIELIKSAVTLGMGSAFLPKNTIKMELKNRTFKMIDMKGLNLKRPLGILYPGGKKLTNAETAFYDMITKKNSNTTEQVLRL